MLSKLMNRGTIKNKIKNPRKLFSLSEMIVMFFMFLGALNFINRSAFCVFVAFVAFLVFCGNYIKVSSETVFLLILSICLLIFWDQGHESVMAMTRMFAYPMCFILGYNLPRNHKEISDKEDAFKIIAIILALGTWLHLMLNFIINFANEEETRNTVDFWLGIELSATGQATLACLVIAVAVALLFAKNKLWIKIAATVALILTFYYNLILAGRSMFILLFACAAIALYNYMKSGNRINRTIIVFFCLLAVAIVCVIIYNSNLFGVRDIIEESNFYNRFFNESNVDLTEDTRGGQKVEYLKYLIDYPWGGAHIYDVVGSHAHDLYLDTYDEAGVFTFAIIVIIVIRFAFKTLKVLKSRKISFGTKQLLLCLFVSLNLQFWMEPILVGAAWLLSCFCILYGNLCSLVDTVEGIKRTDLL